MTKKSNKPKSPAIPPEYTLIRIDRLIVGKMGPSRVVMKDDRDMEWQVIFLTGFDGKNWGIITPNTNPGMV